MNTEIKHYGKSMNEFNSMENALFSIDQMMYNIFGIITSGTISGERVEEGMGIVNDMIMERNKIVSMLMEKDFSDMNDIEVIQVIETSKYGWSKFLTDVRSNKSMISEVERLSVLN